MINSGYALRCIDILVYWGVFGKEDRTGEGRGGEGRGVIVSCKAVVV